MKRAPAEMTRSRLAVSAQPVCVSLADLLLVRSSGLGELETWAVLCQAVQALQDLFLSDGTRGGRCVPLVAPDTLLLSSRGRVSLSATTTTATGRPVLEERQIYLAPEYRPGRHRSDTDVEKMWIYSLGEILRRCSQTSVLSPELNRILEAMTRPQSCIRASLMYLLDVISEFSRRREQTKPFSHVVMDLHREVCTSSSASQLPSNSYGLSEQPVPPAGTAGLMKRLAEPELRHAAMLKIWPPLGRTRPPDRPKVTKEASTSVEDLSALQPLPSSLQRPKSMHDHRNSETGSPIGNQVAGARRKLKVRRNPVQRAASRLYRAASDPSCSNDGKEKDCVGPEFVVRASLPSKQLSLPDPKSGTRKVVTVIMLNGQRLEITCNPNTTTAGQLFELLIQEEHIEENFMLGLSAMISSDFVFLPADYRICKIVESHRHFIPTLFVRIRFFLPSLRGVRSSQARHLLYLQLRRSLLEHQLACPLEQLTELAGLALQAEFGDFKQREHGSRDYFLPEHYIPETVIELESDLRTALIQAHIDRRGLDVSKAEHEFIVIAQTLPHYGGHFYTASWVAKNKSRQVWLSIGAQGINMYDRSENSQHPSPSASEMFEWKCIQTLCYSKHYLCILPRTNRLCVYKLRKYKLRMDHKKSYFTFRLASLHHQFFLRLRTEYASLQSLSQQFGVPLKDIKNESNALCRLESLSCNNVPPDETPTKFKISFPSDARNDSKRLACRRSKSVNELSVNKQSLEEHQNKENEKPNIYNGLELDSVCLTGLPGYGAWDKRRGVKMGTRAFASNGQRVSRSMEAMNTSIDDEMEGLSLQSVSLNCSSCTAPNSPLPASNAEAYVLDSSIKSCDDKFFLNFQETLSESLLEKLNNLSFAEERILRSVTIYRDKSDSLGIQITEGSDGKVYIQSIIPNGPADKLKTIYKGDQIVAVNGQNLLSFKYDRALQYLKNSGRRVEFVLSQSTENSKHFAKQMEFRKSTSLLHMPDPELSELPYRKHILYEATPEIETVYPQRYDFSGARESEKKHGAVIVDFIPKTVTAEKATDIRPALPRSLGLGRRWKGPVKYPVTPVKNSVNSSDNDSVNLTGTSDDEQVFI